MVGSGLTPPHIRFYISDHGYGHASRSIAIIRELQSTLNAKVSVRTLTSANFIEDSVLDCDITMLQNDVGPIMDVNTSSIDYKKTIGCVNDWYRTWDTYIEEETQYCQKNGVDLILSDITPQVFHVSENLKIPGIAISNFTWDDIYSPIHELSQEVSKMKDAYSRADAAIILPLHGDMNHFKEKKFVPLISREITKSRTEMRQMCKIANDKSLVYVGSGLSIDMSPSFLNRLTCNGINILVSSNSNIHGNGIYRIPKNVVETQNYIGMCDLVITKSAYSTVAEAVRAKIPLLLYHREGILEDIYICNPILENKIGEVISWETMNETICANDVKRIMSMKKNYSKCSDTLIMNGVKDCINYIGDFL